MTQEVTDNTVAKPICVVYIPEDIVVGIKINTRDCEYMMIAFEKDKPDYHWFVFPDYTAERIEFKVFYEKDFTTIQYEELRTLITNAIDQPKTDETLTP